MDAYATSKQSALAAAMALARETPRLRINAMEPGFTPATSLGTRRRECVRASADQNRRAGARAIAHAVREDPEHAEAGCTGAHRNTDQ